MFHAIDSADCYNNYQTSALKSKDLEACQEDMVMVILLQKTIRMNFPVGSLSQFCIVRLL